MRGEDKILLRLAAVGALVLLAPPAFAAPSLAACLSIDDPMARVACYDGVAGRAAVKPLSSHPTADAPAIAAPPPAREEPAPQAVVAAAPSRQDFDSVIVKVAPLRHGYYRLELADKSAFETTATGAPPPAGASVHIRRTLFGTTFLDIAGRRSITVRRSH